MCNFRCTTILPLSALGDLKGKQQIPGTPLKLPTSADLLVLLILQTQHLLAEDVHLVLGLAQDSLTVLVVIQGLF